MKYELNQSDSVLNLGTHSLQDHNGRDTQKIFFEYLKSQVPETLSVDISIFSDNEGESWKRTQFGRL